MSSTRHEIVKWSSPQMGGRLEIAIATDSHRSAAAKMAARRTGQRVGAWAGRLSRFSDTSDLSMLNATADSPVAVRPTLGTMLRWAAVASDQTNGIVDATLLDARLAAETGTGPTVVDAGDWAIRPVGRSAVLSRSAGVRFDLDGLAKGWLADRAANLLSRWPGVAVDADGDIALRAAKGMEWLVDVADPRLAGTRATAPLTTLRLRGGTNWCRSYGIATSGTSIHRWQLGHGREAHHLIDPRTRRPAETDILQATVVAPSASAAEVIAKAAVIVGSRDALGYLSRSPALAAILLLESGELACLPGVESWLA